MGCRNTTGLVLVMILVFSFTCIYAENIDPYEDDSQYAYGENVGWLNFEPSEGPGVHVSADKLTGYVWAENMGWINLSPASYGGVFNNRTGLLFGYAWGENVGWINFNPQVPGDSTHYGVTIDHDGNFAGWAWGENIGWIHFRSTTPVPYRVKVCVISFDDLANFADDWLVDGPGLLGDFNGDNKVDFADYSEFGRHWHDYCPSVWLLK